MGRLKVPTTPPMQTKRYKEIKGVDFSTPPTECKPYRSPDSVNMLSDKGGNPVKRLGWRKMHNVNGEVICIAQNNGVKYVLSSQGIYAINGTGIRTLKEFSKPITDGQIIMFRTQAFFIADKLYKLQKSSLGEIQPYTVTELENGAYIPTTFISKNPDGTSGVFHEGVSTIHHKQTMSFLGNEKDTVYHLDVKGNYGDEYNGDIYIKFGSEVKVEVMNKDGVFEAYTNFTLPESTSIRAGGANIPVIPPKITLGEIQKPLVAGQDNVKITFEAMSAKIATSGEDWVGNVSGQAKAIVYSNRVFIVEGDNRVYYSDVNKIDYFPDSNYIDVGHSGKIKGLFVYGENLLVVTDETIFLIEEATKSNETLFTVKTTSSGTGAVATRSFATLVDEPLFLARTGIFGITGYYTNTKNIIRNRSKFIDKKLVSEPHLEKATAVVWDRYYMLCVNNHCYVLDGRQTTGDITQNTNYLYEAYYIENVPANCFLADDTELWFGTSDGRVCKFNTDVDGITAYCDDGTVQMVEGRLTLVGGQPIYAKWSTLLDNDNYPQNFKTLSKRGTVLNLIMYSETSVTVSYSKNGEPPITLGRAKLSWFDWSNINFDNLGFIATDAPQEVFTNKKVKKYKSLQFIFENNELYEPFGVLTFTKTYSVGSFAR